MATTARSKAAPQELVLKQMGFTRSRGTEGYRRNGLRLQTESRWLTLQQDLALAGTDSLRGQLGKPGLWKQMTVEGRVVQAFDLPAAALTVEPDEDEDTDLAVSPLETALRWALTTLEGQLPDGWQSPPKAEVESWVPTGGLTIQAGPFVRQGAIIHRSDRLALSFPLLHRVSDNLSPNRMHWLLELLRDGQGYRMVRLEMTGSEAELAVYAEVDLSGAPLASLECLFKTGLDALRWVVHQLVGSAAFLADSSLVCRSLEDVCPMAVQAAERKVKA